MDDGTLGGDVDCLVNDYLTIVREGKELGLVVNPQKCEIITNDLDIVQKFHSLAPEMVHTSPSVATLLGAPTGSDQGIADVLRIKLEDLKRLSENLKQLNAHDALFLLKNCFSTASTPKLLYMLRCAACYKGAVLSEYDGVIRDSFKIVLNVDLTDDIWKQATLPVPKGGLGVLLASDLALPTFYRQSTAHQSLLCSCYQLVYTHRLQFVILFTSRRTWNGNNVAP